MKSLSIFSTLYKFRTSNDNSDKLFLSPILLLYYYYYYTYLFHTLIKYFYKTIFEYLTFIFNISNFLTDNKFFLKFGTYKTFLKCNSANENNLSLATATLIKFANITKLQKLFLIYYMIYAA